MRDKDQEYMLSKMSGQLAMQAVRDYAQAAALEELIVDGSHSENQMFFVVRALCAEHGFDTSAIIQDARQKARAHYAKPFGNPARAALHHHVTGAVERGEAVAVTEQRQEHI